jgi:hypothetical protein
MHLGFLLNSKILKSKLHIEDTIPRSSRIIVRQPFSEGFEDQQQGTQQKTVDRSSALSSNFPINNNSLITMKSAILTLLAVSGASAFAPSQSVQRNVAPLAATAELEGMVGVDIETGKKIVRIASRY